MKNCNFRRIASTIIAVAIVSSTFFIGCTKVDTSLGGDFTPADQGMKLGQKSLYSSDTEGNRFFQTRLYHTDSIQSSNLKVGYMGTMQNDTFGMRTASFYSQYIPANLLNSEQYEGFGYRPIFDSAMLYLAVDQCAGDTTMVQRYEVFEVTDNSFVSESADSVFFPTFDMTPYIAAQPAFTFSFPDQNNGIYTTTSSLRMKTTDVGEEFIERLMLLGANADVDDEIYTNDEEWVEKFKGLYVRPVANQLTAGSSKSQGAVFASTLESSGFGIYARNREPSDATLIKDTVGMTYLFYTEKAEAGNVSINSVRHDYQGSQIANHEIASYDNQDVDISSTLMVEGMSGVVSQITFSDDFFALLDKILVEEQASSGEVYESLFFNQAKLMIYTNGVVGYDPSTIMPGVVTPWLNYMSPRLGLYLNYSNYQTSVENKEGTYSSLQGIADYAFAYESSYDIDYGGDMNRSMACYEMNISSYLQALWNNYLTAKEEAEGKVENIDWDKVAGRKIYLAPTAEDLFSLKYATAQGQASSQNGAPIRLELTYTMIR